MRNQVRGVGAVLCGLALLAGTASAAPGGAPSGGAPPARVDVNSASAAELARLPGIGPSKAQAIVEHRTREPFHTPDDLRKVKGIGDKLLDSLRDQITVGESAKTSGRGS